MCRLPHLPPQVGRFGEAAGMIVPACSTLCSMLRLTIGSCILRLSLLRGSGVGPPWTDDVRLSLSAHELSPSMTEPMLSISMLILAKSGQARSKS